MTKYIALIFAVLINNQFAYPKSHGDIPEALIKKAHTASNVDYLSRNEKRVILYMNLARLDGRWFAKKYLNRRNIGRYSSKYVGSLRRTLMKTRGLQPLLPARGLSRAAAFHARDMGKKGMIGHNSSDGTNAFKRIKRYAKGGYMAENCSYGYDDPLAIVLQLLVDDRVRSLGHRKNILSRKYTHVGVAIEPHRKWRFNCVQDFSDRGDN